MESHKVSTTTTKDAAPARGTAAPLHNAEALHSNNSANPGTNGPGTNGPGTNQNGDTVLHGETGADTLARVSNVSVAKVTGIEPSGAVPNFPPARHEPMSGQQASHAAVTGSSDQHAHAARMQADKDDALARTTGNRKPPERADFTKPGTDDTVPSHPAASSTAGVIQE